MIDILKAKKTFKEYVKNYNPNNGKIALKISHIERTANISKKTAEELNLEKEDVQLAELIGLLHDIGRFEQIKRYNTFMDKDSINHGEFGVKLLFKDGLIKDFIDDRKYDSIIYKAILNHNRSKIESNLTDKELLHSKIIRDSDKTDIMYTLTYETIENTYCCKDISKEKITDQILKEYMSYRKINYNNITTHADIFVAHMAYVFDFNFDYGLKIISDNNYLSELLNKVEFKDEETRKRANLVYSIADDYVENRVKEDIYNGKKITNY